MRTGSPGAPRGGAKRQAVLLAVFAATPALVLAQETGVGPSPDDQARNLDRVVVQGEIVYRDRTEDTAPTLVYDLEYFQRFEPDTVGDMLKRVPSAAFVGTDLMEYDNVQLRGLGATFGRQTVTGQQVRDWISQQAGIDLSKVFAQYLGDVRIPAFEYRIAGSTLSYRWEDVVPGFDMPVRVRTSGSGFTLLRPTGSWQTATLSLPDSSGFAVDPNFYVVARDVTAKP